MTIYDDCYILAAGSCASAVFLYLPSVINFFRRTPMELHRLIIAVLLTTAASALQSGYLYPLENQYTISRTDGAALFWGGLVSYWFGGLLFAPAIKKNKCASASVALAITAASAAVLHLIPFYPVMLISRILSGLTTSLLPMALECLVVETRYFPSKREEAAFILSLVRYVVAAGPLVTWAGVNASYHLLGITGGMSSAPFLCSAVCSCVAAALLRCHQGISVRQNGGQLTACASPKRCGASFCCESLFYHICDIGFSVFTLAVVQVSLPLLDVYDELLPSGELFLCLLLARFTGATVPMIASTPMRPTPLLFVLYSGTAGLAWLACVPYVPSVVVLLMASSFTQGCHQVFAMVYRAVRYQPPDQKMALLSMVHAGKGALLIALLYAIDGMAVPSIIEVLYFVGIGVAFSALVLLLLNEKKSG